MEPLSLLIRWAHVVGMAAILGGALLVWWLTVRPPPMNRGSDARLEVAQRYEWIFWIAIGVQAMTGVGNLGAFGQSIPTPATPWGVRLTLTRRPVASSVQTIIPTRICETGTCPVGVSMRSVAAKHIAAGLPLTWMRMSSNDQGRTVTSIGSLSHQF